MIKVNEGQQSTHKKHYSDGCLFNQICWIKLTIINQMFAKICDEHSLDHLILPEY